MRTPTNSAKPGRSPRDISQAIEPLRAISPIGSGENTYDARLMDSGFVPVIDSAAVTGGCSLWCVPQQVTDTGSSLGQRQKRVGVARHCAPSRDVDVDFDMFESARLDQALQQLLRSPTRTSSSTPCKVVSARFGGRQASLETSHHKCSSQKDAHQSQEYFPEPWSPSWKPVVAQSSNCLSVASADSCNSNCYSAIWQQRHDGMSPTQHDVAWCPASDRYSAAPAYASTNSKHPQEVANLAVVAIQSSTRDCKSSREADGTLAAACRND